VTTSSFKRKIIEEILIRKERVKIKKEQRLIMNQVGLDFLPWPLLISLLCVQLVFF
jgi:hypothetical protein